MIHRTIAASLALSILGLAVTPNAVAQCDITHTDCWKNGGNCNIKFKNKTGDSGGSDGGTNLDQRSSAQTVVVKAKRSNGNTSGNKLSIVAGASNTMNMEKKYKKDFDTITIASQDFGMVRNAKMSCNEIVSVLNGNGTCKIFHGAVTGSGKLQFYLGYQCDSGNTSGPKDASSEE